MYWFTSTVCHPLVVRVADMQKFPLRMKDNDLLVTELYKDPTGDKITALSVYITPKASEFLIAVPVVVFLAARDNHKRDTVRIRFAVWTRCTVF